MASNTGTVTSAYTGIASLFYSPDFRKDLIARYGDDDDFCALLDASNSWNESNDFQFYQGYDRPLYTAVPLTSSTVTNSPSADVTVTTLTTGNSGLLTNGKQVRWLNGSTYYTGVISGLTTSAGADTFHIKSTAAGLPNIVVANTNTLYVYSNTQEAGSSNIPTQRWGIDYLTNLIQIFRVAGSIDDVSRARQTSDVFPYKDMATNKTLYGRWDAWKLMMLHRCDIGNGLMFNTLSDYQLSPAGSPTLTGPNGGGLQTTRGYIPTTTTYGWNNDLSSLGTWTTTDMVNINAAATARRAPMTFMGFGATQAIDVSSIFFKNMNSSGVTSVRLNGDKSVIDFEMEAFKFGGRTWKFRALNTLNNNQTLASTDPYTKTLYWAPEGKVPVKGKDGKTRYMGNYVGVEYMPVVSPGSGDAKFAQVHIGGLATRPTSDEAVEKWISHTMAGLSTPMPYTLGYTRVLS